MSSQPPYSGKGLQRHSHTGPRDGGLVASGTMVDISPNSSYYDGHTGATHVEQGSDPDGQGVQSLDFYEINNTGDEIDFDLSNWAGLSGATLEINSVFGATAFQVRDRGDGNSIVIDELNGFDSDVWHIDISSTTGQLRLTDFNSTEAAIYTYATVYGRQGV